MCVAATAKTKKDKQSKKETSSTRHQTTTSHLLHAKRVKTPRIYSEANLLLSAPAVTQWPPINRGAYFQVKNQSNKNRGSPSVVSDSARQPAALPFAHFVSSVVNTYTSSIYLMTRLDLVRGGVR